LAPFYSKSQSLTKKMNQQIEQNLNYDFSLAGDDGKALEPVFGSGLTGLANLGNRQIDKSFS
jgi:ubiquitin carboxyl-terminal hydrolase 5/13